MVQKNKALDVLISELRRVNIKSEVSLSNENSAGRVIILLLALRVGTN